MAILSASTTEKLEKTISHYQGSERIYMAEIMDTRDPKHIGDLKVWILNSNKSKNDPKNWVLAHSCTLYGNTFNIKTPNNNLYYYGLTSFGNWNPMPYVGNYVFVFFPNVYGGNTEPYWFGSPLGKSSEMIPGISYDLKQSNDYTSKCEINYKNDDFNTAIYEPLQNGLELQGLDRDRLRGISTASPVRDTPSHCYGFLSPLGNQMVIDDGWSKGDSNINWINNPRTTDKDNDGKDDYGIYHSKKNWIASLNESDKDNKLNRFHGGFRFRTRNGTQLLILDAGNIYMINKDGTAWVELSEDGYIDCYSAFGINAASEGDINLHSTNINIEATDTITLNAKKSIIFNTSGNINANSSVLCASTKISTPSLVASNGNINSLSSGNGNIIGIFAGTLQGTALYSTSSGMIPIQQPTPIVSSCDLDEPEKPTYYDVEQEVGSNSIPSINTRVPTHEPWAGHDKNNSIPELSIKQVLQKEEKIKVNNTINTNMVY